MEKAQWKVGKQGIASLILVIISTLVQASLSVILVLENYRRPLFQYSAWTPVLCTFICATWISLLIGVRLGIHHLRQPEGSRTPAILGLVISGIVVSIWIGLYVATTAGPAHPSISSLPTRTYQGSSHYPYKITLPAYSDAQFTCPGALPKRVKWQAKAKVLGVSGGAVSLYESPDPGAAVVGTAQPGEIFATIAPPECHNGVVWWKGITTHIEARSAWDLTGWIPESDGQNYWLEPVK